MSVAISQTFALPDSGPWPTIDPFLFCVHHDDAYPAGDARMAPKADLAGRSIGNDFSGKDGWSMYHGDTAPGFPQHPHRGFETVTVARRGHIDHSDSLGARARFGEGDLQWMTAGKGVVHSEMFPLLAEDQANPTELFQIWLNLPADRKMADPYFAMFWRGQIPSETFADDAGRQTLVTSYAKPLPGGAAPPTAPPASWAADPANSVGIWTIKLDADARWTLPATDAACTRCLYVFTGDRVQLAGVEVGVRNGALLAPETAIAIENGAAPAELLLLEGRPIGEPVAQHGPFVMNDQAGLQAAFADYRRTGYGGWRWPEAGPVHGRDEGRFAAYPDGRIERP